MESAILWTGGKDSTLALHRAVAEGYKVRELITLTPLQADFLAHPLSVMSAQSKALGVKHRTVQITEPYHSSYKKALKDIRASGINAIITGDIDYVDGFPNWIEECSHSCDLKVVNPLWQESRESILTELLRKPYEIIFSYVKLGGVAIVQAGDKFNRSNLNKLSKKQKNLDLCGEQGEFHTLVLNAPLFHDRLHVKASSIIENDMSYLRIEKIEYTNLNQGC